MATSLRDNLTSSYFNAAHKLYSKKARRRIIAYVESYDDVAFWRTLLEEFEEQALRGKQSTSEMTAAIATETARFARVKPEERETSALLGENNEGICFFTATS